MQEKDLLERYMNGERNFQGLDLSCFDLSFKDLSGINLSGANLSKVNFQGTNLSFANLSNANLSKATLIWSNLRGADLHKANLRNTILSTFLRKTWDFIPPVVDNFVSLITATQTRRYMRFTTVAFGIYAILFNLSHGKPLGIIVWPIIIVGLEYIDYLFGNVRLANLRGANLREVDLTGAELCGGIIRGTQLTGARMPDGKIYSFYHYLFVWD